MKLIKRKVKVFVWENRKCIGIVTRNLYRLKGKLVCYCDGGIHEAAPMEFEGEIDNTRFICSLPNTWNKERNSHNG